MSKPLPVKAESPSSRNLVAVVCLMIVTVGLYWYYLAYQWAKEVNGLVGREKHRPIVVLLVSILTCGIAGMVYECVFAFDVAAAAASRNVVGRMENLPTWLIVCNCVAVISSAVPYGIVLGFPLGLFATALLQAELNKLSDADPLAK